MKTAFLDRDGTINRDYPDSQWSGKTVPEMIPGAVEGLRFLQKQGYALIMITNHNMSSGKGISSLKNIRISLIL